jgi:acetyl-CoA carboxylase biotin carboxylase subunit
MFKKILIANRGEIALRVIHACRELGIKTVAVYSEADEHALHVRFADEDICIGPARSAESYLSVPAIISAAEITGADALHPGYGFLSESAYLAEVCEACHIRFIGPDPNVIRLMGDKARARRAMKKAGVPILPGSEGPVESEEQALKVAKDIGYPVIIKATAGGGGRGMRVVQAPADLPQALKTAQREAEAAFGIGDVYIEKYVVSPRHIEFQVLGDHYGSVVSLGERECSIQRRHQKLIEESPSVALTEKVRRKMGGIVVDAARAVQYANAGTFEFLMDADGRFYFMEVNTRLQVEHPVTEMVTGIDIVKEQIRIAAGERLSFKQSEITFTGHAIECRINAEDPETFTPSPGTIHAFSVPGGPGVRVDTAAHTDCFIPPYYDSMIAKVIAYGRDRQEAIARMRRTLEMTVIEGIRTTIPLHLRILAEADFQAGRLSTSFMDRFQAPGGGKGSRLREAV